MRYCSEKYKKFPIVFYFQFVKKHYKNVKHSKNNRMTIWSSQSEKAIQLNSAFLFFQNKRYPNVKTLNCCEFYSYLWI